jgi:hypothetical protein
MNRPRGIVQIARIVALTLVLGAGAALTCAGSGPAPQISKEGGVTVKVTPLELSAQAAVWRFEIVLDTHVTALDHDMTAVTVLSTGVGHEYRPLTWEGDKPGGHHRKGVLTFKPIRPAPSSVALKVRHVGVPERTFSWPVTAK